MFERFSQIYRDVYEVPKVPRLKQVFRKVDSHAYKVQKVPGIALAFLVITREMHKRSRRSQVSKKFLEK